MTLGLRRCPCLYTILCNSLVFLITVIKACHICYPVFSKPHGIGFPLPSGAVIYFGYGVWHSVERHPDVGGDREVILYDIADEGGLIVDGAGAYDQ